jgi:CRISPR-associated protein Csb2
LRALISAGYTRLGWGPGLPEEAQALLRALASVLPSYTVPPATLAHSRHYMPIPGGKPTLVMDAWAQVDSGELFVHWPVDLKPIQIKLLGELVESLNYLGRAESWVEGRLLEAGETPSQANVMPHENTRSAQAGQQAKAEVVFLAAPLSPEQYRLWREQSTSALESSVGKQTQVQQKAQVKAEAPFPETLLDAMQWDTARWKSFGWSQAPGLQWVPYRRPKQSLAAWAPPTALAASGEATADMVLLALATPSGNCSALPVLSRTLPQAELLHKSLVSCGGQSGKVPSVLSGCADDRSPLKGHAHAHVLPLDLDKDGHLDHALLWAPMGFDREALAAIRALKRTWAKGVGELRVAMAGQALRGRVQDLPEGLGDYLAASRSWVSLSPFVPPRFVKRAGANSPEGQIKAELVSRGLPVPRTIFIKPFPELGDLAEKQVGHFRHFMRRRQRGGAQPPQDLGWFVRLEFEAPVQGPLCLGYGSHFGLGLFVGSAA